MNDNEKQFEKFVCGIKFDDTPDLNHRDRLEHRLLQALSSQKPQQTKIWRMIMKSNITKLAVAAAIIIAITIGISRFGIKINVSSPAFAKVLEQIKKARSVYYKTTLQVGNNEPFLREMMINKNGVQRLELDHRTVLIFDFPRGIILSLQTITKKAYRTVESPRPEEMKLFNSLDFLATRHEKGIQFVGMEVIDGMETELYKDMQSLNFLCTSIWVDPKTSLPVRVVRETIPPVDANYLPIKMLSLASEDFGDNSGESAGGNLSGNCTPQYTKEVMTDFEWNVDLDPDLFNTEIPADYEPHEVNLSQPSEAYLIEALGFWAEMSGGSFPADVNDLMDPNIIKPMIIKKFAKGQNPHQEYRDALSFMDPLRWGAIFAERKIIKGDWHANTEPVYFGEADKPLYWWQCEDSNDYRVIFGDLSTGNLPAEELP